MEKKENAQKKKLIMIVLVVIGAILFVGLIVGAVFGVRFYKVYRDNSLFLSCISDAMAVEGNYKDTTCDGLVLQARIDCNSQIEEETNQQIGSCYRETYLD